MLNCQYSFRINENAAVLPFCLCTVGVQTPQSSVSRPDGIEHHQLLFCRDGRGHAELDGMERPLVRGDIFYLPPRVPHRYAPDENLAWTTDWISFSGTAAAELLPASAGIWHPADGAIYADLLEQMSKNDLMLDYHPNSILLYELLLHFREETMREKGVNVGRTRERLKPVLSYMQAHSAEPLTIRALAEQLGVTDAQFCRIFRSACHTRPTAYLNFLRVTRAKELMLSRRELTLSEIADAVGFGSASYFARIFLRTEGVPANVWRSQH